MLCDMGIRVSFPHSSQLGSAEARTHRKIPGCRGRQVLQRDAQQCPRPGRQQGTAHLQTSALKLLMSVRWGTIFSCRARSKCVEYGSSQKRCTVAWLQLLGREPTVGDVQQLERLMRCQICVAAAFVSFLVLGLGHRSVVGEPQVEFVTPLLAA